MKRFLIIALSSLAAASGSVFAAEPAADYFTVISEILANNPDLKTRRLEIEQARLEASDANALSDPEVGVTHVWGSDGIGNKLEVEVSQSFDWPGVYGARSKAAKMGNNAAEMLYRSACVDLALAAKQKLIELAYQNRQLSLLQLIKANTDSVQAKVEEGYRGGELTILDSKKMQIEQYKLQNDIADITEAILMLKSEIQAMCPDCRLNLDDFDSYPMDPKREENEYLSEIADIDPVISAGRLALEQETLNAKAARQQRWPGFSVGYIYQKEMGDVFNGFSLSMTLPFFQNRKARAVALSRAESTRLTNAAVEANRRTEVQATLQQLKLRQRQIEDYNRTFGDNSYLTLLLQAYQGGQINVIDYLAEVNYFYEATRACLTAEYQYSLALASLNRYSLIRQ